MAAVSFLSLSWDQTLTMARTQRTHIIMLNTRVSSHTTQYTTTSEVRIPHSTRFILTAERYNLGPVIGDTDNICAAFR